MVEIGLGVEEFRSLGEVEMVEIGLLVYGCTLVVARWWLHVGDFVLVVARWG